MQEGQHNGRKSGQLLSIEEDIDQYLKLQDGQNIVQVNCTFRNKNKKFYRILMYDVIIKLSGLLLPG